MDKTKDLSKMSQKYKPIPDTFTESGYTFTRVKVYDTGWEIFKRQKGIMVHYELILPKPQDEFEIHGNKVEAKIKYPSTGQFGRLAYSCISLERAENLYETWVIPREKAAHEEKQPVKIQIPKNKKFTLKDIFALNSSIDEPKVRAKILELETAKTIKVVGSQKNKIGRASKIYIYN